MVIEAQLGQLGKWGQLDLAGRSSLRMRPGRPKREGHRQ